MGYMMIGVEDPKYSDPVNSDPDRYAGKNDPQKRKFLVAGCSLWKFFIDA
jgi:hypothetical protein